MQEVSFASCNSLAIYTPRDSKSWRYAEENDILHNSL